MIDKNKYMREYSLINKEKISEQRSARLKVEPLNKREHRLKRLAKWRKENRNSIREYARKLYQTDDRKFKTYNKESLKRGYEFKLSYEDFLKLFHGDCAYCRKNDARGIDRVNNLNGYIVENCVSCCEICNRMKWRLTKDEFFNQIKSIYQVLMSSQ